MSRPPSVPYGRGRAPNPSSTTIRADVSIRSDSSKGERAILSVSELTRQIRRVMETGFPGVTVQGELSGCKLHTSGHFYFTLKDEGAALAGVMWRSRTGGLTFDPKDGMKVIVTGRITVYEVRGNYQIDATAIRPLGAGELQLAFERLKARLMAEGLFDEARKKPLPPFPERIGIVTSATGAALHDMLTVLRRRFPGLTVILNPARVQGAGAGEDVARAIGEFNAYGGVDVLIVGRGGGSIEDLWAFNEEVVARAIAASRIPVVSAVGHEVDFTIADFVADLRAPTPSAAAELVVRSRAELLETLGEMAYTLRDTMLRFVEDRQVSVRHILKSHAFNRPLDLLRRFSQRADELERTMTMAAGHAVALARSRQEGLARRLESLDHRAVLRRGFAMVFRNGALITSSAAARVGDRLDVRLADGDIHSVVTSPEP